MDNKCLSHTRWKYQYLTFVHTEKGTLIVYDRHPKLQNK